jgi:hypothetical protein
MLAVVSVSDAINSSLSKVITSKRACLSEVVVHSACTLTTTSIVGTGCKSLAEVCQCCGRQVWFGFAMLMLALL